MSEENKVFGIDLGTTYSAIFSDIQKLMHATLVFIAAQHKEISRKEHHDASLN